MKLRVVAAVVSALALSVSPPSRAEIIEEVVAKVNDDIITMSELEREEQAMVAELYRQYTGPELDRQVTHARSVLLQSLIDRKLLIHRAERLYDIDKMEQVLLQNFMEQEGFKDTDQLERALAQSGMSLDDIKRRLIDMAAPQEVIRFEVEGRLAVGDSEVLAYYEAHPEEFLVEGEVTLREIVLLAPAAEQEARRPEAEAIRERLLEEDADFGTIAVEVSEAGSAATGGLIGPFKKGDLVAVLDASAFSLPLGVISPVIATENGLHVIQIETRTEDVMLQLEDVKEELRLRIEDDKYSKALGEFLTKARNEADIWVNPRYVAKYPVQVSN